MRLSKPKWYIKSIKLIHIGRKKRTVIRNTVKDKTQSKGPFEGLTPQTPQTEPHHHHQVVIKRRKGNISLMTMIIPSMGQLTNGAN